MGLFSNAFFSQKKDPQCHLAIGHGVFCAKKMADAKHAFASVSPESSSQSLFDSYRRPSFLEDQDEDQDEDQPDFPFDQISPNIPIY